MEKKLKVILEPEADSVTLLLPKKGAKLPLIIFDGDLNLLCGSCDAILVEGLNEDVDQIINLVVRCPVCRSYNEINVSTNAPVNLEENIGKKPSRSIEYFNLFQIE